MFKNYLKVTLRNIKRHKGYSIINILGLAIGITAFLFISIWILYEVSFDRFHENASSIYRINEKRHFPDQVMYSTRTPGLLSPTLRENFPEIKEAVRLAWTGERVMRSDDIIHYENWIMTVDPEFFSMFNFPFVKGDKNTVLQEVYSIVITEDIAEKYFGTEDPMGKIMTLENMYDFTVTGVIENIPSNSTLQFEMAVPFEIVGKLGWAVDRWDFSLASTYLYLEENVNMRDFEKKIAGYIKNYDNDTNIELFLQPLTQIHLYSNFENPRGQGRIQFVFVFSFVGILILIMACINFMNLTTARSESRSREIGMRKVIGAYRGHLARQFLIEAVLISFVALVLVLILLELFLPVFNEITGVSYSLSNFGNGKIILFVLGVTFLTGIISGSYPALFLSSFQPVKVLRGDLGSSSKGSFLRKTLVFIQFSISLILIIVSFIIYSQIDFLKNKDLGFNKDHVISIPLGIANAENSEIYTRLKNELKQNPRIENISASFTHPAWFSSPTENVVFNGKRLDEKTPINITSVDYDFIETLKIEILKGRSFSRDFPSERGILIVNETFESLMEVDSAVNSTLSIGDSYKGEIVGVMRDFHMESVSNALIGPLILFHHPRVNYIFARVHPENISTTLESIENAWNKIASHLPFNYNFLDEELNKFYEDVARLGTILKYFTIMAAFIACLGLMGLTSFSIQKRTKEIGVRKILGSSIKALVYLLCREYLKLVILANIFAWPISWLRMSGWLKNFAYHVSIAWIIFIQSGLLALGVAFLTVSFQTIKASFANPVESLRYE